MAVLLTGGTGKTSTRIAGLLRDVKIPFLLASRRGEEAAPPGMPAIKFDWLDPSTHDSPFQHNSLKGEKVSAIYLVAPEAAEPAPIMNAFIDLAISKYGVKRFVLMAGGTTEPGGPFVGQVWQHLLDIGVDYCVLRPTWFMDNFLQQPLLSTMKDESKIYTACGNGKIPFVSAADIGAVAFHALVDETPHNTEYRVLGGELLTYDQIAAKFSHCLGRDVKHVKLSGDEVAQHALKAGVPEFRAKLLAFLETRSAEGMEERENDVVEKVTGRPPQKFDAWVRQHKEAWQ